MKLDITTLTDITEGYERFMDSNTGKVERRKATVREIMARYDADTLPFAGDPRGSMMQMNQGKP